MSKMINMYLETNMGKISIPFVSLKVVDSFTVNYENRVLFLNSLFKILGLSIDIRDVRNIYLGYEDRGIVEYNYDYYLPVKYGKDNYNVDSLILNFSKFLKDDQRRLNVDGVKQVGLKLRNNFKPGYVSSLDIDLIARVYLKDNYRRMRDTYFMLCDDMFGKYSIKIDKLPVSNKRVIRDRIDKLESKKDNYIQYLIELSSRGEEFADVAMEELSKIDSDDVRMSLGKSHYGIFDGLANEDLVVLDEVRSLEEATGMSVDAIRKHVVSCLKFEQGRKR